MSEAHRAASSLAAVDDLASLEAEFTKEELDLAVITRDCCDRPRGLNRSLREILATMRGAPAPASPTAAVPAMRSSVAAPPDAIDTPQPTTSSERRKHWWTSRPRSTRRKSQLGAVVFRRLDREQRARLWFHARALEKRTKLPRRHGGVLGDTGVKVLDALLHTFLNMKSGRCDPGYEAIAAAAGVAESTVGPALDRLETSGLMRRVRRAYWTLNALGQKALRQDTNAYLFEAPADPRLMLRDTERRGETRSFFHKGGFAVPTPDDFRVSLALGDAASG
jgi:DNA-binding transcriptional ArsR family regulator